MKKKEFLTACKRMACLISLVVLASCSNSDELASDKGNGGNEVINYIGVNIVSPKSIGSRADDDFEYGTDEENLVNEGLFFIFSNNTIYGVPQTVSLTGGSKPNSSVGKIYNAILVIDGVKEKPTENLQIVCVLNAPEALIGEKESIKTLDQLAAKIDDYGAHNSGSFIMTNSVYKEGGAKVLGATVTEDNIFGTAGEALANSVNIYVERVVAKVMVVPNTGSFTNEPPQFHVDGELKELSIKITGIEIANIAEKSYLIKNIEGISDDWTWVWDETNKRCYWETVPQEGLTYGNKSYGNIEKPGFDINNVNLTEYVQPNTSENQKTAVLVTAQLCDGDAPFDFVYLRGSYFTPDKALTLIAQYVAGEGYYKKTNDEPLTYAQLDPSDFTWENRADNPTLPSWIKGYEVVAKVNGDNLYKKSGESYNPATAEDINKLLVGEEGNHPNVARFYTEGKCYYFVNIDQSPVAEEADNTYEGVVRNHVYKLTLNSIKGIGTPVFDPDEEIIPEKPDNENLFYLSATVNVLAWRIVNQNVDLSGD